MTKLAPNVAIDTSAGAIWMPDWLPIQCSPEESERKALYAHMNEVGLPPSAWNEWRRDIGCERIGDIKSYYNLFVIWIQVAKWQRACKVHKRPTCTWGASIFDQIYNNPNYGVKKELTATSAGL